MVDLTEYAFKIINADEITAGDFAVILNPGDITEYEFGESFLLGVDYKGKQRDLPLNKTNARKVAAAFGRVTEMWISKKLGLDSAEIFAFGKKTRTIIVEPM